MISRLPDSLLPAPSAPVAPAKRSRAKRKPARQQKQVEVPLALLPGLQLLLQAHDYARETERALEDFAVEVTELHRRGLTNADCRWFVCRGWARLLRELKPEPGGSRRFQADVGLVVHRHACLVLTPAGAKMVRRLSAVNISDHQTDQHPRVGPRWDRNRHELRLGSWLIKQFKLPSPNQEMILMALEEEGWPPRIDDPLSPSQDVNAKQRLHDTIKNLNRNQKNRLMRFMGDGTGQGVRWELIVEQANSPLAK